MQKEDKAKDLFPDSRKRKVEKAILDANTKKSISSTVYYTSINWNPFTKLFKAVTGTNKSVDGAGLKTKFYNTVLETCILKFNHKGIVISNNYDFAPKEFHPVKINNSTTVFSRHMFFPDPSNGEVVNPGHLKEGMTGVHVFFIEKKKGGMDDNLETYRLGVSIDNKMKIDKLMIKSSLRLLEPPSTTPQKKKPIPQKKKQTATACRCAACGLLMAETL